MTDSANVSTKADTYVVARGNEPELVPGRRGFLEYAELGVTGATGGRMRAQVVSSKQGLMQPTGWHHHVCEGQFVYILDGWAEVAFHNGDIVRIEAGDSLYIPGGVRHNEIGTSDGFTLLEVSLPADMGTEPCEAPDWWDNRV